MAELAGEHGDLAAVVGVVCDEIGEETCRVGFEAFDAAICCQCRFQDCLHGGEALVKGFDDLRFGAGFAFEFGGESGSLAGTFEP